MDSAQRIISFLKENASGSHKITITVMGSIGRIRSFTISRRILLGASIFFILYILLSLFIINRFIDVRARYRVLSDKVEKTENNYNEMEKTLLKAQQHAANLEAYIATATEQKEESNTIPGKEPALAAGGKAIITADEKGNKETSKSVDIEGVTLRRLNSGVAIDFRLVNMNSGVGAIEGYMHIIATDKNNNSPQAWNTPSGELKNGLPSDYRSGEHFIIQRFKLYHREFMTDVSFGTPASIRILAYDPSGNLILTRDYEVGNVS